MGHEDSAAGRCCPSCTLAGLSVDYAAQTRQLDAPAQDRLAALLALELPAHSRLVLQPWPAVERGLKAAEGIRVRSPTLQKLL